MSCTLGVGEGKSKLETLQPESKQGTSAEVVHVATTDQGTYLHNHSLLQMMLTLLRLLKLRQTHTALLFKAKLYRYHLRQSPGEW